MPSRPARRPFVLVHGAWHGGWCWLRLAPILRAAGHRVESPTLAGLGDRAHLADPAIDLSRHVDDVVGVLESEDLRDAVLVGHSYGSMVVAGAADRVPNRVGLVLYLDSVIPKDGMSAFDLLGPTVRERLTAAAVGGFIRPGRAEHFGVSEPADVAWVQARLTPQPLRTLTEPLGLRNQAAGGVPRAYIACTRPSITPAIRASGEWARAAGWPCAELATGHDAMVTVPEALARALLELSRPEGR